MTNILRSEFFILFCITLPVLISCNKSVEPVLDVSSDHFEYAVIGILSSSAVSEISVNLESNYSRIISDLQVPNVPDIMVRIWTDYDEFLNDMENDIGTRYNGATGYIYNMTEFRLYYTGQAAGAAVHEFAHVVSMYINPSIPNNPRWLWEAVAIYESQEFVDPVSLPYLVSGNYPTLDELSTDYNSSDHKIYSVGYVLLEYIVHTWGMDTVITLIENNGDIAAAPGIPVRQFEAGWYNFLEEKYLN